MSAMPSLCTASAPLVRGFAFTVHILTIRARDAYGNAATSYNGVVFLTASDASSTTSADPARTNGVGTFTVTARDANRVVISGYVGTINFSSSDTKAGLPASYTFTAADAGSHTFTATLKASGTQSITVKDSAIGTAGATTQFVVSVPSTATVNGSISFTLTVVDAANSAIISKSTIVVK